MHRTAVKHKLDLERTLQASTVHRNAERPSTQTCTMASTKGWFCMRCHAVNRYRKGFRALTFAEAKKIMAQCCMYRDCLQAVHYSREQAMTKQENKGKKQKTKHGAVVKFKNTIRNSFPGACFGSLAQAAHAWDWCLSTQRWAQLQSNWSLSFCQSWDKIGLLTRAMLGSSWWHSSSQGSPTKVLRCLIPFLWEPILLLPALKPACPATSAVQSRETSFFFFFFLPPTSVNANMQHEVACFLQAYEVHMLVF